MSHILCSTERIVATSSAEARAAASPATSTSNTLRISMSSHTAFG